MTRIGIDARLLRAFGMGTYVRGLLRGLAELEGDEEYVVFAAGGDRALVPPRFECVTADVPPYTIRELVAMARLATRARLDLLHVPHFVVPCTRLPVVTTLFDAIPFHHAMPNRRGTPYVAWMMQRAASRAARVLAISHAAKSDLLEALDLDRERIVVTHLGVDGRFFHPSEARLPFRYFLFTGRAASHKNLETLLAAFAIVRRRDPELRLVLAGARHERHAASPGVVVPGFVPDGELPALYAGAIALIMPSFMEGFGLPALEAMAAGTAVITSTARALVEVTGDAALHVDPRSPHALADAMERVGSDGELRAMLIAKGRERARGFTWRRCAEETRSVYRAVASRA
ncbi:MAG TPA: glycosyltransferase family 1 protein [Thermoanaerobaculia bacterium]|nr:glycosyltransferase family 1 protein [Thermoanaerobaculia bacterium]